MGVTMMLAIKAKRELRVSSQIDSGGLGCMRMPTKWSRTVDSVSLIGEGRKGPDGPHDGHHPPPAGSFSTLLHFRHPQILMNCPKSNMTW